MEIFYLDERLNSELKKDYEGQKDGFLQVGEKKWFYPLKYEKLAKDFKNFKVRPDDIWIMGYPRSGTTLTEELIWLLSHGLNFEQAKETKVHDRVVFFEADLVINEKTAKEIVERLPAESDWLARWQNSLNILNETKSRRVIKTHLPFELLPDDILKKRCKVIYVCRNPKDVSVSYHFLQSQNRYMYFKGGFQKYWKYFMDGHCIFGPYFEHVKQAFDLIERQNIQFVFYEEFRKDTEAYIRKLAEFIEVPVSVGQIEELKNYIDFDNFRKLPSTQGHKVDDEVLEFIRKGKVNGWKDHFTEEMNEEANAWIKKNTEKIGIRYPEQAK